MPEVTPTCLVEQLLSEELRIRTGLLILSHDWLGREDDIAANLGVGFLDLCGWLLEQIPEGRKIVGVQVEALIEALTQVLDKSDVVGSCILVSNSDFLIAGLSYDHRMRFWDFFRTSFRRKRGLILSFPSEARTLFPAQEFKNWCDVDRIAIWKDK